MQQESLDLMDPGPLQSEGNRVDPFSWPLDTFDQIIAGVDKVIYVIVLTTVFGERFLLGIHHVLLP